MACGWPPHGFHLWINIRWMTLDLLNLCAVSFQRPVQTPKCGSICLSYFIGTWLRRWFYPQLHVMVADVALLQCSVTWALARGCTSLSSKDFWLAECEKLKADFMKLTSLVLPWQKLIFVPILSFWKEPDASNPDSQMSVECAHARHFGVLILACRIPGGFVGFLFPCPPLSSSAQQTLILPQMPAALSRKQALVDFRQTWSITLAVLNILFK